MKGVKRLSYVPNQGSSICDQPNIHCVVAGDGANDVNMIQAADVGIGISGQEGMQVGIDLSGLKYVLSCAMTLQL